MDDANAIIESIEKRLKTNNVDVSEIETKAYKDALYQFYKTLYTRQLVKDFMEEGTLPYIPNNERKQLIERAQNSVLTKPPFALITVNPRPSETYESLSQLVEKFVNKKYIQYYFYVYEVRKADFTGLHCHVLVQYTCRPYDLKRNAKNLFKKICDSNNNNILNIKYINEDLLQSKIQYMLGDKKDSKLLGVEYTDNYRRSKNIAPYYESSPAFPCRVTHALVTE